MGGVNRVKTDRELGNGGSLARVAETYERGHMSWKAGIGILEHTNKVVRSSEHTDSIHKRA
jgi:hypothetical protein